VGLLEHLGPYVGGQAALETSDGAVLAWGESDASQVCDCADEIVMTKVDTSYPQR